MQRFLFSFILLILAILPVRAETLTLLALGDSLTAGLGLEANQSFPAQLEAALRHAGRDVTIINAGVSGDTAVQGAERLDWALTDQVDGVLVELGANDALRGLPPQQTERALDGILAKLADRHLPALLLGMQAPPNLGEDYTTAFNGIYPRLAVKHGAALYPFYLAGVAGDTKLNQADGIHPTAEGVAVIVAKLLPEVLKLVTDIETK